MPLSRCQSLNSFYFLILFTFVMCRSRLLGLDATLDLDLAHVDNVLFWLFAPLILQPGVSKDAVDLPPDWSSVKTKDGETYYYHSQTHESTWDLPQQDQ